MANEITVAATLKYAKAKVSVSLSTSFAASQTGDKYESGIQIIGIVEETAVKNDIGTIGFASFRNMDLVNFVQIGATAGNYSVKLLPGEGCLIPLRTVNAYLKADTAPCEVEYLLIEL